MFFSTRRGELGDLREDTKEYTLLSSWVLWGAELRWKPYRPGSRVAAEHHDRMKADCPEGWPSWTNRRSGLRLFPQQEQESEDHAFSDSDVTQAEKRQGPESNSLKCENALLLTLMKRLIGHNKHKRQGDKKGRNNPRPIGMKYLSRFLEETSITEK